MQQRGNKNVSFPPAFRDLSEKLLVKYSQLYKLGHIGIKTNSADFFWKHCERKSYFLQSQTILKVIPIISILFGNMEIETVFVHDTKILQPNQYRQLEDEML